MNLGDLFLTISIKGVQAAIGALNSVVKAAKMADAALLGLATAGLVGTQEGNRMAYAWQQLARQIAGIALPAFNAAIKAVQTATEWFRNLSGAQQENIFKWAGLWTGIGLMSTTLGFIPGLILTVVSAFKILGSVGDNLKKSFGELFSGMYKLGTTILKLFEGPLTMVLKGIGVIINGMVVAVAGLVNTVNAAIESMLRTIANMPPWMQRLFIGPAITIASAAIGTARGNAKRQDVTPAGGGMEAITATYARIQNAINRADPVLAEAKKQNEWLAQINDGVAQAAAVFGVQVQRMLPAN